MKHVNLLRVEPTDLHACDTVAADPNNPDTHIEPAITHFKTLENTGGSGLLHSYGDMVGLIGSHFRRQEQQGCGDDSDETASTKAEYVLETMEEAAENLGIAKPRGIPLRVLCLQKLLQKSMWPKLLCSEQDGYHNYAEETHNRATLYVSQYKEKPGEAMVHIVAEKFENALKKTEASKLWEFIRRYSTGVLNYTTVFMEVRRLMPVATPKYEVHEG